MSIRGIDTQIMLQRLPDNVKEASDLLKRPEIMQDMLGNQGKLNDVVDQTRVAKLSEAEMEQIRADVDEGSGNEYEESENRHPAKDEEEHNADSEFFVPKERHIIDITV